MTSHTHHYRDILELGIYVTGLISSTPPAAHTHTKSAITDFAHTHPATEVSDSTATGRSLMTAASAAAARTTLGLGAFATQGDGDKGDIVVTGAGTVWTLNIDNASLSPLKLGLSTNNILLGRTGAGPGVAEELTAAQARTLLGLTTLDNVTFNSVRAGSVGGMIAKAVAGLAAAGTLTITGNGDAAAGLLLIRDTSSGGVALLLVDPGNLLVGLVSDPSAIYGAGKWTAACSGANVVITNGWGASRHINVALVGTNGFPT